MVRQPPSVIVVTSLCWLLLTRTPFLFSNSGKEECEFPNRAVSYSGSLNVTMIGFACDYWTNGDIQFDDDQFPDGSASKAKNYCRNPMPQIRTHVWCFSKYALGGWQYCRVCPYTDYKGCQLRNNGSDYSGFVAFTRSNVKCQSWTLNKPHRMPDFRSYRFIDGSPKLARNYCRNPTPHSKGGVWCFTEDPGLTWDYCEVCKPFRGKVLTLSGTSSFESSQSISQVKTRHLCLYFCIFYGDCTVADFDGFSYTCSHGEKIAFDKSIHGSSTLYIVQRVCPAAALGNGRRSNGYLGTYIRVQHQRSKGGLQMDKANTQIKCIMACVQIQNCVKIQFGITSKKCFLFDTMNSRSDVDADNDLYIIQRCMKNVIASEDTLPQDGEEETEPELEIDPGFWADIVDSPTTPEDNALVIDDVTFKGAVPNEADAVVESAQTQIGQRIESSAFETRTEKLTATVKTVVMKTGQEDQPSIRGYAKKIEIAVIAFTVITVLCTGFQIYKEMNRKKVLSNQRKMNKGRKVKYKRTERRVKLGENVTRNQ